MIANAIITRLCHDLINSVGTAQLALEENELEIVNNSLDQAISKLEIFRTIFKGNSQTDKQHQHILNFISRNNLNCVIKESNIPNMLTFFLIQKMISKSEAIFENNTVTLNNFFFMENEIKALEGNAKSHDSQIEITSGNILAYLAYLQFAPTHTLQIEKIEEKSWKITLQNK